MRADIIPIRDVLMTASVCISSSLPAPHPRTAASPSFLPGCTLIITPYSDETHFWFVVDTAKSWRVTENPSLLWLCLWYSFWV